MANVAADDVVAENVVSKWRTLVRQQSQKVVSLADNIVLPKNERIARQISRCEATEMQTIVSSKNEVGVQEYETMDLKSVEVHHSHAPVYIDKSTAEEKAEHFPMFMIGISLTQIFIFYSYDEDTLSMKLGYDPNRRHEVWRFFTAMFVHTGWSHLWGNLVMQLILGVFLEIVHKWKRIALIYLASGFGGSLCITVLDNASYSVGASGAVMGLLFSHLSTIILNWSEMEKKLSRFFCVLLYIMYDVATDVYSELYLEERLNISHAAHFGGAVTGFLVSILALKNFKKRPWEKTLQNICVGILVALFVIILSMNVMLADYYPTNEWNFDYEKTYYEEPVTPSDYDDYGYTDSSTFDEDYGNTETTTEFWNDDYSPDPETSTAFYDDDDGY